MIRKRIFIDGVVQGVGFRPFVYRLAKENSLVGFVKNNLNGLELEVEGTILNINNFKKELTSQLPPLARVESLKVEELEVLYEKTFEILQSVSDSNSSKSALISPDIATCQECLNDIKQAGKYHNYFATNCTNCGPRYSIIETVPYDRKNTSMRKFTLCQSCQDEYEDPQSRRYHAQPISCRECGPHLSDSVENVAEYIKKGKIVAIKGIGGFHLVCDATNDAVVKSLREHKHRATKPFALMCKSLKEVKVFARVNTKEEGLLCSKEAPIVILKKSSKESKLSKYIAPKIDRVGCMLAYTPLHHLLFEYLNIPIVATSANLVDEPIITSKEELLKKLPFVDFILDFNRDILNGIDDSVVQVVDGKIQTLRLARGYAPKVIKLPFKSKKKILAVGANAKNSIAFVMDDNIILSPHIGDLDSLKAFEFFQRTIESFKRFYNFEADIIVHDKHPSYLTTKWAKEQNKELIAVGHHLAHIYACKAEFGLSGDYLGFSFDGTGYGDDAVQKTLWGGEVFVGDKRAYHFKPIKLLGAAKTIKEPRRVALSMLFDKFSLEDILKLNMQTLKQFLEDEIIILHQSYTKNLNTPLSSSLGRVFDAVASFADLLHFQSYEGEAGLLCEQNYNKDIKRVFEYTIVAGVIDIEFDFFDKDIVSVFINTLVKIVIDISKRENLEVILSGGVFQNKTLLELLASQFRDEKILYHHQQESSINDGGIALGQIYYYMNMRR